MEESQLSEGDGISSSSTRCDPAWCGKVSSRMRCLGDLPEGDLLECEGVVIDSSGGNPDSEHILSGGNVIGGGQALQVCHEAGQEGRHDLCCSHVHNGDREHKAWHCRLRLIWRLAQSIMTKCQW